MIIYAYINTQVITHHPLTDTQPTIQRPPNQHSASNAVSHNLKTRVQISPSNILPQRAALYYIAFYMMSCSMEKPLRIMESYNGYNGEKFKDHLFPTPLPWAGCQLNIKLPSNMVLNTSRMGHPQLL